jgi:acetyl-CoA synthetase
MSAPSSAIESVLVENRVFPPSEAMVKAARISGMDGYNALCARPKKDFEGFWARLARENVVWTKPFTRTLDESNAPFYRGLTMANSMPGQLPGQAHGHAHREQDRRHFRGR